MSEFFSKNFKPGDLYQDGTYRHDWRLILEVNRDSYTEFDFGTMKRECRLHFPFKWIEVYRDGQLIHSPFMTRIWEWAARQYCDIEDL